MLVSNVSSGLAFIFVSLIVSAAGWQWGFFGASLAGALGVTLIALWLLNKVAPQSFLPQEDQGYFTVELELPEGATLERTRRVTDRAMMSFPRSSEEPARTCFNK